LALRAPENKQMDAVFDFWIGPIFNAYPATRNT